MQIVIRKSNGIFASVILVTLVNSDIAAQSTARTYKQSHAYATLTTTFCTVPSTQSHEQFSVAMAALTLANICLDVQIGICMFLHPSDILALRKVCRHWKLSSVKYSSYQDL
jgi:hypothetical protein